MAEPSREQAKIAGNHQAARANLETPAGAQICAKPCADRYARHNIRMKNVLPGFIDSLPEAEDRRARIPTGRDGHAREVSSLIAWLACDDAACVIGQNWRIDGGLTRSV